MKLKIFNYLLEKLSQQPSRTPNSTSAVPAVAKSASAPTRKLMTYEFNVAGIDHHMTSLQRLACKNPDYSLTASAVIKAGKAGRSIYQYNYIHKPVKLIPEPNNPYDKNAIQVLIAGEFVGYVPREECDTVGRILKQHEVKYISAFISGGKYKIVSEDRDISRGSNHHRIRVKVGYV